MVDNCGERIILAPGVHDPISARIVERLGFEVVYMGGAATSLGMLGFADFGLTTATEIQTNARNITDVTSLPLIADSDNGYGNAVNVIRTVKDYIRAGAAGIHIEDQVLPKRCGHLKGKRVIPLEEMVGKVRAAKRVIREEDPAFVLIARTDARGAAGEGLDSAIKRLKAYRAAGADMVFADALLSKSELARLGKEVDAPTVYHPTAVSPRLSAEKCHELGVGLIIYPFASVHASAIATWEFLAGLKAENTKAQVKFERRYKDHPLSDVRKLFELGGLEELEGFEKKFLPPEEIEARYKDSVGM
jgi:2,3-dimethylmalate lyase